jgi:aspartyl-tRNA(Asn)/glutamyl-tRNA(Gln) amidotransferase subunit B
MMGHGRYAHHLGPDLQWAGEARNPGVSIRVEVAMDAPAQKKSKLIKGASGDWEVVIGMEVHAQVTSQAKLFSGGSTAFGGEPNSHVSLVDAAMPGMLPVINEECVRQAVRTGFWLNARPNRTSIFDRKNYFYPDLPQGYQISQYKSPIVGEGYVTVLGENDIPFRVGIERLHLEQDAGKLLHDQHATMSLVDLNRCGVALMEIVSKPDLRSAAEAVQFFARLRMLLQHLGTCDGDMQNGHLRADVNVSVHRPDTPFGTRCEIKNLNSFEFISAAILYEQQRQIEILEAGGTVEQETRLFDPDKGETRSMRSKEEAHDYRYFPDPDLLPLDLSQEFIDETEANLPEHPDARRVRYEKECGLSVYNAAAANWVINEYLGRINRAKKSADVVPAGWREAGDAPVLTPKIAPQTETIVPLGPLTSPSILTWTPSSNEPVLTPKLIPQTEITVPLGPVPPSANAAIVQMVSTGEISGKIAKDVLDYVFEHPEVDPRKYVAENNLKQVTDVSALEKLVDEIIAKNPDKVGDAKTNPKAIGWFVGQVMKASGGKANPQAVNDLLKKRLGI